MMCSCGEIMQGKDGHSDPLYDHTYKKSVDQSGNVPNSARGQLNREKNCPHCDFNVGMYYVYIYAHRISQSMDQSGKVVNPAHG